mgnify:FL=1
MSAAVKKQSLLYSNQSDKHIISPVKQKKTRPPSSRPYDSKYNINLQVDGIVGDQG